MIGKIGKWMAFIAVCLLTAVALAFFSLPYLLNSYLLPRFDEQISFLSKDIQVSGVTLGNMIGSVKLGNHEKAGIELPRIAINYTPGGLLKGEISSLSISSPTVYLQKNGGRYQVVGMKESKGKTSSKDRPPLRIPVLPITVDIISIENLALVLIKDGGESQRFTMDVRIEPQFIRKKRGGRIDKILIDALLKGGLQAALKGELDLSTDEYQFDFEFSGRDIGLLLEQIPLGNRPSVKGEFISHGSIGINPAGEGFSTLEVQTEISNFSLAKGKFHLGSEGKERKTTLHFSGNRERINFEVDHVTLKEPEKISGALSGTYALGEQSFSAHMDLRPQATGSRIQADIEGRLLQTEVVVDYEVKNAPFVFQDRFSVGDSLASGVFKSSAGTIHNTLQLSISSLEDRKTGLRLEKVYLDLPVTLKNKTLQKETGGSLGIDHILYKQKVVAQLKVALYPEPEGIYFSSLASSPVIDQFSLQCNGIFSSNLNLGCSVPSFKLDQNALTSFMDLPEDLQFSGETSARLQMNFSTGRPEGHISVQITDGEVEKGDMVISGIQTALALPRFPEMISEPHQLLRASAIQIGKINLKEGAFHYRLDGLQELFIEKARVNWVGGRVETGALELRFPLKELRATLYCDRLEFAELLAQFGVENAEGEGSLNGRLPVSFDDEGIVFDEGFLFSTPGSGGIIRFNDTDMLRQGMGDISEAGYLEYSLQAMENFAYNWTKVTFTTEEDVLLMALQLDGKPAEKLPFTYRNGQIVKSKNGSGLQHPIRLDANFRLPLGALFQYGKNIQSIMENM